MSGGGWIWGLQSLGTQLYLTSALSHILPRHPAIPDFGTQPYLTRRVARLQACTGSGKTLAFLVPLYELLARRESSLRKMQAGALVIEPTRELAAQVMVM